MSCHASVITHAILLQELLAGLFEVDIERRWTAKQALGHAWVQVHISYYTV